jgi:hypothetical protein
MRFWIGVLVPEYDFRGALSIQRNFSLPAIIGLGLLFALILIVNAVRKIRLDLREAASHMGRKLGPFELLYRIGGGGNGTAHPNTVAVFDFGQTPEGTLYYAMEHLSGVTLDDLVRISGPQIAARVLCILNQINFCSPNWFFISQNFRKK